MWVVCVWKVWFHKWAYVFYRRQRKYILSNKEKRYSFSNEWKCRWDWKRCCAFYHQRVNLSSKKFYRPKANLFCRKWRKSRVWHDSRVIVSTDQKSVFTQLVACSKRSDSGERCFLLGTAPHHLKNAWNSLRNSQQHLICCKTDLNVGGKTRNISSLYNTFCSNAAKQVTRFCCPFCCSFTCCVWFASGAIDLFFLCPHG